MTIESLDLNKAVSYLGVEGEEESWRQFDEYHRAALLRLEAAGADVAIIASNTPHHRLPAIVRGVAIPVLCMFDAVAKESARIAATQVLILGTAPTMGSPRFREAFAKHGIEAAGPADETARARTVRLIADLQRGEFEGAGERLIEIAKSSIRGRFRAPPAVCLACTELPLAFPQQKTLPALVSISHVLFKSAIVQDVAAVTRRAHEVGVLVVVDVYQSAGTVPVDVREWDADFAVGGSVKWLCAWGESGPVYRALAGRRLR